VSVFSRITYFISIYRSNANFTTLIKYNIPSVILLFVRAIFVQKPTLKRESNITWEIALDSIVGRFEEFLKLC